MQEGHKAVLRAQSVPEANVPQDEVQAVCIFHGQMSAGIQDLKAPLPMDTAGLHPEDEQPSAPRGHAAVLSNRIKGRVQGTPKPAAQSVPKIDRAKVDIVL